MNTRTLYAAKEEWNTDTLGHRWRGLTEAGARKYERPPWPVPGDDLIANGGDRRQLCLRAVYHRFDELEDRWTRKTATEAEVIEYGVLRDVVYAWVESIEPSDFSSLLSRNGFGYDAEKVDAMRALWAGARQKGYDEDAPCPVVSRRLQLIAALAITAGFATLLALAAWRVM